MTQETPETTTKPYATVEDKVVLFEENGVEIFMHYDWLPVDLYHKICFVGESNVARRVERIAAENGLKINRMQLVWDYYRGKPHKPYWIVDFF